MRTVHFFSLATFLLVSASLFSQDTINFQMPTSINLDGAPPDGSAILDVQSMTKGMLTPRMTTAQRTAIATPATGLLVFDVTTDSFWFFDGTEWVDLSATPSGIVDADGDTGIQAELTPDNDRLRFRANGINAMVIDTSGKVGIGVPVPEVRLDVAGTVRTDGFTLPTGAALGHVLKSNASGQATWQSQFPPAFQAEPELFLNNSLGIGPGPYNMDSQGDYVYVVDINSDDLKIVNISEPANPFISGSISIGPGQRGVAVQGSYVYVIDVSDQDLKVFNVSDPTSPVLSGSLTIGLAPTSLTVQGNYAYVTDSFAEDLKIINVSNPASPVLSGSLSLGSTPWAVAVQDTFAYVVDLNDGDLRIINVADPANPILSSSLSIGAGPYDLAVQGNYVYALLNGTDDFIVVDVSDPANPALGITLGVGDAPQDLVVQGNYAFVLTTISDQLQVIDISDPAVPLPFSSLILGGSLSDLAVQGSFAFVGETDSDELKVIQLSGTNVVGVDHNGELVDNPLDWVKSGSNLRNTNGGNVGIGRFAATNRLEVNGNASKSTAGDWLANSDARLKTNIRPLDSEEVLRKMLSLQGITYEWDDDVTGSQRPEGTMYGFTAQNIREVFPELVTEDNLGFLQTAYGTYDAMTVEAMRAQQNQIEGLKKEIADLQSQLADMDRLKSRMEKLEAVLPQLADSQGEAGED